jgi:hypothetical protein
MRIVTSLLKPSRLQARDRLSSNKDVPLKIFHVSTRYRNAFKNIVEAFYLMSSKMIDFDFYT